MWELILQALLGGALSPPPPPVVEPGMTHEAMMANIAAWTQASLVAQQKMMLALVKLVVACTLFLHLTIVLAWLHLWSLVRSAYQRGYEAARAETTPAPASTGKILGV